MAPSAVTYRNLLRCVDKSSRPSPVTEHPTSDAAVVVPNRFRMPWPWTILALTGGERLKKNLYGGRTASHFMFSRNIPTRRRKTSKSHLLRRSFAYNMIRFRLRLFNHSIPFFLTACSIERSMLILFQMLAPPVQIVAKLHIEVFEFLR